MLSLKDISDSNLFLEVCGCDESGFHDQVRLTDISNKTNAYQVKILGALSDDFLLVSYPVSSGSFASIRKNQVFQARRFDGKSFYEFSSEVVEMSFGPVPYLVISVPNDSRSEVKILRDSVRKPVNLPVTLSSPGVLVHGICANISTGGALVLTLSRPEFKEGVLTVALSILGRKIITNLQVDLMREEMKHLEDEPVYICGLRFGQKSDMAFLSLHMFLSEVPR